MKTIALLCPGPSLAQHQTAPWVDADLIVGVNRVPLRFKCDVWAVNDYPPMRKMYQEVIGKPAILSRRQTLMDMRHRLARFERLVSADDLPRKPQVKFWWQK